jgi:hypothetical protein
LVHNQAFSHERKPLTETSAGGKYEGNQIEVKEIDDMNLIKMVTLTTSEARELEKMGFVLEFVMMHLDGTDTYRVYGKEE